MERERWTLLSGVVAEVDGGFVDDPRVVHATRVVALVHLWSAARDRPTSWACLRENWRGTPAPAGLPGQSTMSRRMRVPGFERFMLAVGRRLDALGEAAPTLVRVVDGKPLEVPRHSTDRGSAMGRGVGAAARGYKLHAVFSNRPMPEAFAVTPMNVCEKKAAARLIGRVDAGCGGYLLADAGYDASVLHDRALHAGMQLLCPRNKPGTGLGQHYQSPGRLRAMAMLEGPALNGFGRGLYARRTDVERRFAHLVGFGGGLAHLPPWVRRPWRVRRWVIAKLLIDAARIVLLEQTRRRGA